MNPLDAYDGSRMQASEFFLSHLPGEFRGTTISKGKRLSNINVHFLEALILCKIVIEM